jgi:hypothetical protein
MSDVLPTDVEFAEAFTNARVSRGNLARYYLRAMELKHAGGDPCLVPNPETDVVSLEHVLPENPDPKWNVKSEVAQAFYKRIGNLALLSTPINNDSGYGNSEFSIKKPLLAAAPFKLTQEIARYSKWEPDEIAQRQSLLAELAVKTWPLRS